MSSSKNPSTKMAHLQAFINNPLIIISSSDSEEEKEGARAKPKAAQHHDPTVLTLITRKTESEAQRLKRRMQITKICEQNKNDQQAEAQIKKERQQLKQIAQERRRTEARQSSIRHQFSSYAHLPFQSLLIVKELMEKFYSHPQCQIDSKSSEPHISLRMQYRQNLTKYLLLTLQELELDNGVKNETEKMLCGKQIDRMAYSYKVASQLETTFYKKLFKRYIRKTGDCYEAQLKIVLKELADKNHIQFRRKIIARTYPLDELAKASEESLVCEKTKQDELEQKRLFVRQNQKINPFERFQVEEEVIQPPQLGLRQYYNEPSDVTERQALQQKQRHRKDLAGKNKLIYKTTCSSILKSVNNINERIRKLRSRGFSQINQLIVNFEEER